MTKGKKPAVFRHGDVIVMAVEKIPANAKRKNHLVLAHGEVTGHSHRIAERDVAEIFELGADSFLNVKETATLVHDEHASISLPAGTYRFWRQREYTPEAIR